MKRAGLFLAFPLVVAACATTSPLEKQKEELNRIASELRTKCEGGAADACTQLCEDDSFLRARANDGWLACLPACRAGRAPSCQRLCNSGHAGREQACHLGCQLHDPQSCASYFHSNLPIPGDIKDDELEAALDTKCAGGDAWACYVLGLQRVSRPGAGEPAVLADVAGLFKQTCRQPPRLKDRAAQTQACRAFECLTGTSAQSGAPVAASGRCSGRALHSFRGKVPASAVP